MLFFMLPDHIQTVPGHVCFCRFFTLVGKTQGALPEKSRGGHFSTPKSTQNCAHFVPTAKKLRPIIDNLLQLRYYSNIYQLCVIIEISNT